MTREKYLTLNWNNLLSLTLGLPALIFVIIAISTTVLSDKDAFIGIAIIGSVYWIIVEQHAAMRFAWLKKKANHSETDNTQVINRLTLTVYNLVWWLPIVFVLLGAIDYKSGFIGFTIITVVRLLANLYRNNVLSLEQAINFPFRSP